MNSRVFLVLTILEQIAALGVFLVGVWVLARTKDPQGQVVANLRGAQPGMKPEEKRLTGLIQTDLSRE